MVALCYVDGGDAGGERGADAGALEILTGLVARGLSASELCLQTLVARGVVVNGLPAGGERQRLAFQGPPGIVDAGLGPDPSARQPLGALDGPLRQRQQRLLVAERLAVGGVAS